MEQVKRRDPKDVLARRIAWKWERVEREAAWIEAGVALEPSKGAHHPWDEIARRRKERNGNTNKSEQEMRNERQRRYRAKLEAKGLKNADGTYGSFTQQACVETLPEITSSCYAGGSLQDRVRVLTEEEWARL